MPRPTREAAQKALNVLWNIDPANTDSDGEGHDDNGLDAEEVMSDETGASQQESDHSTSSEEDGSTSESDEETSTSKDGTNWTKLNQWNGAGRIITQNMFTGEPGVNPMHRGILSLLSLPGNC